jgi:hypothetical protein
MSTVSLGGSSSTNQPCGIDSIFNNFKIQGIPIREYFF